MGRYSEQVQHAASQTLRGILPGLRLLGRVARHSAPRRVARILVLGAAQAALVLVCAFLFFYRVTAGQVGVRQAQLGTAGVESRDRGPGLHPGVRWFHAWHLLDARVHVASFGLVGDPDSAPALTLRTEDGNRVTVAATVLYRIRPGEAWRLVAGGLKHAYHGLALENAASVLRSHLAQLTSDEFASTEARQACVAEALPELNVRLAPLFLEAEAIQLSDVSFWSEYEKAREAERLARESMRRAQALARLEQAKRGDVGAEEIEAEEKRIRADAQRELAELRAEAQLAIARLRSEADGYASALRSEADATHEAEVAAGELALERAEAERERALGAALAGDEGRVWLAREAAGRIQLRHARLNASDPRMPAILDLDAMVRLLLGTALEGP